MNRKILVGMSGGVDSAVAALLLQQQGFDVIGATLLLRGGRLENISGAGAAQDIEDARRVCEVLHIEHRVLDFSTHFCTSVVDEFVEEYRAGRTPNPCVTCNRTIKFGALLSYALENGIETLATGHYAHTAYDEKSNRWQLFRSTAAKDQSYVLYGLSQQQLSHVRFPLWEIEKSAVRVLAREHALPVAQKGDSMETCFVPAEGHAAFMEKYTGEAMLPGEFVDEQGQVLGRHKGIGCYTIGQRKGLGMAFGRPMYVIKLDAARNRVVLGEEGRQCADTLVAKNVNFVSIPPPQTPLRVQAKIRYQSPDAPATIYPLDTCTVRVIFDTPQRSVTPGQSVVFYQDALVLGGGIIDW